MIIYAVICRARDAAVLADCASKELRGNASQVTQMLLEHLRDHPGLILEGECKTFVQRNEAENDFFSHFIEACATALGDDQFADEHYFHLYFKEEVYYCCLGDDPDVRDQKV